MGTVQAVTYRAYTRKNCINMYLIFIQQINNNVKLKHSVSQVLLLKKGLINHVEVAVRLH